MYNVDENTFLRILNKDDVTERYIAWLNDYEVTKFTEQKYFKHTYESVLKFVLEKNNSLLLPLEAIKGQKPYLWIVNNKIISENNGLQSSKDILWQPASLGVNTLNVIDANGHSDTIKVVIKKLKK